MSTPRRCHPKWVLYGACRTAVLGLGVAEFRATSAFPVPVVRLVVTGAPRRVLILRRHGAGHALGEWCLPSGNVDCRASVAETARTALKDETGLDCLDAEFLFHQHSLPRTSGGMHCINGHFGAVPQVSWCLVRNRAWWPGSAAASLAAGRWPSANTRDSRAVGLGPNPNRRPTPSAIPPTPAAPPTDRSSATAASAAFGGNLDV